MEKDQTIKCNGNRSNDQLTRRVPSNFHHTRFDPGKHMDSVVASSTGLLIRGVFGGGHPAAIGCGFIIVRRRARII